jgi:hypothetical protein
MANSGNMGRKKPRTPDKKSDRSNFNQVFIGNKLDEGSGDEEGQLGDNPESIMFEWGSMFGWGNGEPWRQRSLKQIGKGNSG